jgi:hypothetical protein
LRVYHRTSIDVANQILLNGFRDGQGTYLTDQMWTGVWVSDVPLDENSGACGDTLLALDMPASVFEEYEWVEELKGYRESLIPADILNKFGPPKVVTEEEE